MAVYIEWIAQKSLLSDPRVEYMMAMGKISERQMVILREASKKRVRRVIDRSIRRLDGKKEGLSRSYEWGPSRASMIQVIPDADARLILSCSSREEFREVDSEGNPLHPLIIPDTNIYIASREDFRESASLINAMRA